MSDRARSLGSRMRACVFPLVAAGLLAGSIAIASAAGPRFGAYTGHKLLPGAGHLETDIHVDIPTTTGSIVASCGKPSGNTVVTEQFNSAILQIHHGTIGFNGNARIERFTTTQTNALIKQSHYRGSVHVTAGFAHHKFTGKVKIAGSPCDGVRFTASWLPPPKPG